MIIENRFCLLIGGPKSLSFDQEVPRLEGRALRGTLDRLAGKLAVLGADHKFRWNGDNPPEVLVDPKNGDVVSAINSLPRPSKNDVFFLVYVGHSRPWEEHDLILSYSDCNIDHLNGNFSLSALANVIKSHGFLKTIYLLDCCHANRPIKKLLELGKESYLMFSSTDSYAVSEKDGGIFTKAFASNLTFNEYETLDERVDRSLSAVTLERTFRYTVANMPLAELPGGSAQAPTAVDGGLAKFELAKVRKKLPRQLRDEIRFNSIYRKLFAILEELRPGGKTKTRLITILQGDEDLKIEGREEFKYRKDDADNWLYVSEIRIGELIEFLREAHLVRVDGEDIQLTTNGEIASDRRMYTESLRKAILENIFPKNCTASLIRNIIISLLHENQVPDANAIITTLYWKHSIVVPRKRNFIEGLRLLPYCGVFERPTPDTIFPGLEIPAG